MGTGLFGIHIPFQKECCRGFLLDQRLSPNSVLAGTGIPQNAPKLPIKRHFENTNGLNSHRDHPWVPISGQPLKRIRQFWDSLSSTLLLPNLSSWPSFTSPGRTFPHTEKTPRISGKTGLGDPRVPSRPSRNQNPDKEHPPGELGSRFPRMNPVGSRHLPDWEGHYLFYGGQTQKDFARKGKLHEKMPSIYLKPLRKARYAYTIKWESGKATGGRTGP
jgi:hypothetical protein